MSEDVLDSLIKTNVSLRKDLKRAWDMIEELRGNNAHNIGEVEMKSMLIVAAAFKAIGSVLTTASTEIEALEKDTPQTTTAPSAKEDKKPAAGKGRGKNAAAKVVEEELSLDVEEETQESEETSDDLFGDEAEEESAPEITAEAVRKVVKDFAVKHGKDNTLKLLKKFKSKTGEPVTSIPDLKTADYGKLVELAKKHMK